MSASNYNQNNYLCPPSLSGGIVPLVEYNANWGGVPPRVIDDPQVKSPERLKSVDDEELRSEMRRARRKLMADLASEFASSHDELLRDLAR